MKVYWSNREENNYEKLKTLSFGIDKVYINKMERSYDEFKERLSVEEKSNLESDLFSIFVVVENNDHNKWDKIVRVVSGERYKLKQKMIISPLGFLLGKRSEEELIKNKSLMKVSKKYFKYLLSTIKKDIHEYNEKEIQLKDGETEPLLNRLGETIVDNVREAQIFISDFFNILTMEDKCNYLEVCSLIPEKINIPMQELERELILTMIGKDEMEASSNKRMFNTTHVFQILSKKKVGEKGNDNIKSILGTHSQSRIDYYIESIEKYLKSKIELNIEIFNDFYKNQFEVAQIIKRASLFKDETLTKLFKGIVSLEKYKIKKEYVIVKGLCDTDTDSESKSKQFKKIVLAVTNDIPADNIYMNGSDMMDNKLNGLRLIFNGARKYIEDNVINGIMYTTKDEHVMEVIIDGYHITEENLTEIKEEVKNEIESKNFTGVFEMFFNKIKECNLKNLLKDSREKENINNNVRKKKI